MLDAEFLERNLRDFLALRPGEAGRFLRAIADAMAEYERAQKQERGRLADRALLHLLTPELAASRNVVDLLPAFVHQFPRGPRRGAPIEQQCWDAYLPRIRAYFGDPANREWLEAHPEYAEWWLACVASSSTSTTAEKEAADAR